MAGGFKPAAVSMTWEELENCSELDRQRVRVGTLLTITTGGGNSTKPSATLSNSRARLNQGSVQILKRQPNSDPCLSATENGSAALNRPMRTLEEREAAYAAARERILGPSNGTPPAVVNGNGGGARKSTSGRQRRGGGANSANSAPRHCAHISVLHGASKQDPSHRAITTDSPQGVPKVDVPQSDLNPDLLQGNPKGYRKVGLPNGAPIKADRFQKDGLVQGAPKVHAGVILERPQGGPKAGQLLGESDGSMIEHELKSSDANVKT